MTSTEDDEGLSTEQVAAGAEVTFRMVDHWSRRGYLRPLPRRESSGVKRRYSAGEADVARRMAVLVRAGIEASTAAAAARATALWRLDRIALDEHVTILVSWPRWDQSTT